jgi:hypothetical protein
MSGMERSYLLRLLAALSIVGNLLLGAFKVVSDDWLVHSIFIVLAIPLFIGTHLIIRKFEPKSYDDRWTQLQKEAEADKWFARLMFGWFGVVVGGLYILFFVVETLF